MRHDLSSKEVSNTCLDWSASCFFIILFRRHQSMDVTNFDLMFFLSIISPLIIIFVIYWLVCRRRPLLPIEDKAVFISGCDSGIGLRVALHLHSLGLRVFAACLSLESFGAKQLADYDAQRLHLLHLDVRNHHSIQAAAHFVEETLSFQGIKGLFHSKHFSMRFESESVVMPFWTENRMTIAFCRLNCIDE